jgi:hypothetical protein
MVGTWYTWPEILVGIGEWLGVPDAARGMSRCLRA